MGTVIVYHAACSDGFGAAWAARRRLGDGAVRYVPAAFGKPPPDVTEDEHVFVLDFSYRRPELLALHERARTLVVLDHHKTAQEELEGLEWCAFDMKRSGAMLAWDYFHPELPPPRLIDYVQDRDLWRWALPASREVCAWIDSYPREFETWDVLHDALQTVEGLGRAREEGTAILRYRDQQVAIMCDHAYWSEVGGWRVPVTNATVFFSEVGEELCKRYPDAPFSAYFHDRSDGARQWGLRSRNGFDVSAVAKRYGGGGHAAAAGFIRGRSLRSGGGGGGGGV